MSLYFCEVFWQHCVPPLRTLANLGYVHQGKMIGPTPMLVQYFLRGVAFSGLHTKCWAPTHLMEN